METEMELGIKIRAIIMHISRNHPQLARLIGELPITIRGKCRSEMNIAILKEYYNSLKNLLKLI